MSHVIGCDLHKRYSVFTALSDAGEMTQKRVNHTNSRQELREYLRQFEPGTPLAFETMSSWYWFVEEVERAGLKPKLANAYKAKMMMGNVNKHDKLDSEGLVMLLRNGTLPAVWIPPGPLRDQRELLRWRMDLVSKRVGIKNRVHGLLIKHGILIDDVSDIFSKKGKRLLWHAAEGLPPHTKSCLNDELKLVEDLEVYQWQVEARLDKILQQTPQMKLLQSAPGIGEVLAAVIWFEIGDIRRFPGPENLASYAGTTPRIHASGGKIHHGQVRKDVNRYLKYAFVEAANSIVRWRNRYPERHTTKLYNRIRAKKNHPKAVVAVARHLAEASYWMLTKNQEYVDPSVSSTQGKARPGTEKNSND